MDKVRKLVSGAGCASALLAPLLAVILYPRAKWLFAFVLVGVAVLVFNRLLAKDPAPDALAEQIERLLNGNFGGWDVDDFEHAGISNPELRALWRKSIEVGGPPEGWGGLDDEKKNELRALIRTLRHWPSKE